MTNLSCNLVTRREGLYIEATSVRSILSNPEILLCLRFHGVRLRRPTLLTGSFPNFDGLRTSLIFFNVFQYTCSKETDYKIMSHWWASGVLQKSSRSPPEMTRALWSAWRRTWDSESVCNMIVILIISKYILA